MDLQGHTFGIYSVNTEQTPNEAAMHTATVHPPDGTSATRAPTPNPLLHATNCPECQAPVQQTGRCLACPSCGWGKCG